MKQIGKISIITIKMATTDRTSELFGFFISAMELVGTSYRIFAGIVVFYFSALGYVMLAAIAYLSRNWSYTQIAISAPALLILSYFW